MNNAEVKEILSSKIDSFGYGEVMHEDEFCRLFNIEKLTESEFLDKVYGATKGEVCALISSEVLSELSISEVVKTELRKLGRHMLKSGKVYRVCLPSENEAIAAKYKRKAAKANNKAKNLLINTPKDASMQFTSLNCIA